MRSGYWGIDVESSTTSLADSGSRGDGVRDNYRLDQTNADAGADSVIFADQSRSTVIGLYFEDEIRLAAWVHVTAASRYDRIGLSGEDRLSPRRGLILSPWHGGTLKVLGGEAFRSPIPTRCRTTTAA